MAASSSGRRDRFKKIAKGGTESSRKHHFESFTQRIAKLNIDPIRRVRRQDVDHDDLSTSTSYFQTGLSHWKDLNLSENFTAFVREVEPLCDSFVQILHYHRRIVDTLCRYMELRDALSLEPLLSLTSHLAHDLGTRFETHFAKVVTMVTSLAAKHHSVEVVEWSFTCLAWLLKYLSRLLVPDLRAVYDIIAPLLGKEPQKKYVTEFAAEAMSFLVRKAALAYSKNKVPLTTFVGHVMEDLERLIKQGRDTVLYQYGLMILLAESIKGINRGLHSCGTTIWTCWLQAVMCQGTLPILASLQVLRGVTISILHHTDEVTFLPILNVLLTFVGTLSESSSPKAVSICAELLYVVATVRQGSRIQGWQPVINSLALLLQLGHMSDKTRDTERLDYSEMSAAVVLQYSPLDLVIPMVRLVMEFIFIETRQPKFLLFCTYFCELGRDRFLSLISPYFFKCVSRQLALFLC